MTKRQKPIYESKTNKIKEEYPELMDLYQDRIVQRNQKQKDHFKEKQTKEPMNEPESKPTHGIAVDGYCRNNTTEGGLGGYRGMDISTGAILFNSRVFDPISNNIAEFMAIGHALMYCKKEMDSKTIYSDSQIGIGWIERKKCNTALANCDQTALLNIGKIERWLLEQKFLSPVTKWQTKIWGEIPADFGHKK